MDNFIIRHLHTGQLVGLLTIDYAIGNCGIAQILKALDILGPKDQQLLVSVSFDAMPVHVPVMHW